MGNKNQNIFGPPPEEQLSTELKEESKAISKNTTQEPVHITIEEKLSIDLSRDGDVHSSELTGVLYIFIRDEQFARIKVIVDSEDNNVSLQVMNLNEFI